MRVCVCVCGRDDRSYCEARKIGLFWRRKWLVSVQICIALIQKQQDLEVEGVQSIGRNMSVSLGRILALTAGKSRGGKPFTFITD